MTTHPQTTPPSHPSAPGCLNDQQASDALDAVFELAVSVRDDGPEDVRRAAQAVLDACGGDPVAAVTIAAALVRTDLRVDVWWQRGLAGVGRGLAPCGTHAAFNRHKARGEEPDEACREAEAAYQAGRPGRRLRSVAS